jgi:hypothetical protein
MFSWASSPIWAHMKPSLTLKRLGKTVERGARLQLQPCPSELALYCLHHHLQKKAAGTVPATGEAINASIETGPRRLGGS